MTKEEAKQAWYDRVYNDADVQELLKDETWRGVVIGFFIGCGFSVVEAYALSREVEW